jgi:hypothetical protein
MVYVVIFACVFTAFVIWINLLDSKRRAALSIEQKQEEDERHDVETRIW